jgi:hypothetical protein
MKSGGWRLARVMAIVVCMGIVDFVPPILSTDVWLFSQILEYLFIYAPVVGQFGLGNPQTQALLHF